MKLFSYKLFVSSLRLWLVLGCLYSSGVLAQDCKLRLENLEDVEIKTTTSSSHSQITTVQKKRNETFKVRNTGDGACSFFVSFSGSTNVKYLRFGDKQIAYGLYDSVQRLNPLKGLPAATERNLLTGEFKGQKNIESFTYFYFLETNDFVLAGLYSDSVQVELYEGVPGNHILHDSRTITFSTDIAPFINVIVQGGQGAGSKTILNFGMAKPEKSLGFNINVNANIGYEMTLESQNRGVMRLDTQRLPNTIPYTLYKEGKRLDLSSTVNLLYLDTSHYRAVARYDFIVTISGFDYVLSGEYEDTITVTVLAR
jgi:spore coat protein U-like protein